MQLAYFERDREPVAMDIGPVLDLQDVAGGKVCALASRVEPRDDADTAAHAGPVQPGRFDWLCPSADRGSDGPRFR